MRVHLNKLYPVRDSYLRMRHRKLGNFLAIAGYHVAAFQRYCRSLLAILIWRHGSSVLVTFILSGLAITAGHHGLFAHKTYDASPVYEWFWLTMSALAGQMSALSWSNDHRIHHSHVDTEKDPYNINRGFWYAHVWWLFVNPLIPIDERIVGDLLKNKRVMFADTMAGFSWQ